MNMYRLNPTVLDRARELNGFTSDEKLAAELDVSGTTVRNWRHGRGTPSIQRLMQLRTLARTPLDDLLIEDVGDAAA